MEQQIKVNMFHLHGRMKKRFLIGRLKETFKERMAKPIVKEHPELIGEKFRPALDKKYQDYVEELLAAISGVIE